MIVRNPILPGFHPDPSICRAGDAYYLVTTTLEYFPGIPVYRSANLVSWELVGHCLTRRTQLDLTNVPSSRGVFAPTIRFHDGLFVVTTTLVGAGGNVLLTARDPAGPWSEPTVIDEGLFDPSLFFDDDGRAYYTRRGSPGIVQAEIDVRSGRLLSPLRPIVDRFISPDIEGPHVYKIGGRYFLMAAEGGSRFGHAEVLGRSTSPWGPFEPCPHNPILTHRHLGSGLIRDVGHADLVEGPQGTWWAVCLGTRHLHYNSFSILGRETFLVPVRWTADGWPLMGSGGIVEETFETNALVTCSPPADCWHDDFTGGQLERAWVHLRNPSPEEYSLALRPGWLALSGNPVSLRDVGAPAFVARRQQHFEMRFACAMEFAATGENEEAGITIRMTEDHHFDLAVTARDGARCVILRRTVGDLVVENVGPALADECVVLSATCDGTRYRFAAETAGAGSVDMGSGLARLLSPEVAHEEGAWTGIMLGLYATGNGAPCRAPAFIDWCSYEGVFREGLGFRIP
jgi:alpha-N-arabinofuranosidase